MELGSNGVDGHGYTKNASWNRQRSDISSLGYCKTVFSRMFL